MPSIEPMIIALEIRCPNHYVTDEYEYFCVKLIQYKVEKNISKSSLNGGGWIKFCEENVGHVSVLKDLVFFFGNILCILHLPKTE